MATCLSTPKLTATQTLHSLCRRTLPLHHHSQHNSLHPRKLHLKTLTSFSRSRFSSAFVRAESDNGAVEPRHYDFDLFTIGAGSGGVRASRFAANFGASVAICELPFATVSSDSAGGVGGTCVLRGCVPKKLLVYASKYSHEFEESRNFGWRYETEPKHDWSTLIANKNAELHRLIRIYKNILKNAGVTLMEGRGKIVDPHTVDVDGKLYSARHILISVGARPYIPDIPGNEYAITSDDALDLPEKPEKIAIIGGGYIALEFAGIFNGLSSDVHVFIRQKKVLRGFDEEIRDFIAEQISVREIELHTEETPQAIVKSSDGSLALKTNKGTADGFSHVMFATGRRPNTENLGLEEVGVKMSKDGAIEVDEFSRTSVPSIWAVGDATNRLNLTPVALMEGGALAKTLFANEPTKPDYRSIQSTILTCHLEIEEIVCQLDVRLNIGAKLPTMVNMSEILNSCIAAELLKTVWIFFPKYGGITRAVPSAVFSQPQIGQVGLTEEQAIEKYDDVDIYTANYKPLKATISGLPDRVFMKLIVAAKTDNVLGLHVCGDDAAEMVQGFAVAVKAGLTKTDFDATVGIHPTSAEELVTMRTPTRKIRACPPEGKKDPGVKAATGV
ncbi:Glutathione reductase, chloroplastic-like protein [Drosera capensis]